MHVISDVGGPGGVPRHPAGHQLVASVDVEWTKNYRIRDGNQAFCYSIVWLIVPAGDGAAVSDREPPTFHTTSVYLDRDDERQQLVEAAALDVAAALTHADVVTGHQLCSDLAVLAANSRPRPPAALVDARRAWHERRAGTGARVVDTRFDAGHLLTGRSRRLVDVCTELDLDVSQPELTRTSMTALHRDRWLAGGDVEARERITVLNLRHSLSTALVASRCTARAASGGPLNVNAMLAGRLDGRLDWLRHPTFRALLPATPRQPLSIR